jgi:small subunit ribosomal protein S16
MPVRIRLQRHGRRKRPFYHIVVADARAPRDGKFIEKLGTYNPMTVPATIELDRMSAYNWLTKGAQPSDTVRAILRFKGVLYYKHLMRGVAKGALTQEEATEKWQTWVAEKEGTISARREAEAAKLAAFHQAVSGTAPVIEEPAAEEEAPAEAAAEEAPAEEAGEEAAAEAEAPAEEAPEAAAEEATEEAPTEEEAPAEEEKEA